MNSIKTRPLGKTDLTVSPIGLGLAALGRPGYINLGHADDLERDYDVDKMRDHAHRMLDTAYEHGVRYFDAARSYGRAEEFLGSWLKSKNVSDCVIGSKWGYTYTADWQVNAENHEVKEHSRKNLDKQWLESQALLGHHLNLYQIHSATLETGVLDNAEVLEKLAEIKETGVYIGLSLSGPSQAQTLEKALRVEVDGERLFDTVQATWNVLETSASDALAAAHQEGLGVIVKEALANGRLTRRNDAPEFTEKLKILTQQAERLGTTVETLALAAVLQQPWISVVLSGAAKKGDLLENLDALNIPLDEEVSEALAPLAEAPERYWRTRSGLEWT